MAEIGSLITGKDKAEGLLKASRKSQKEDIGDFFTTKDRARGLW